MNDFAKHLGKADLLILAPIYSAGEIIIKGIDIFMGSHLMVFHIFQEL